MRAQPNVNAIVVGVAVLLTLALGIAHVAAPRLETSLSSAEISADSGFGFVGPVPLRAPFGYTIAGDDVGKTVSNLRLLENGEELAPAHAVHADIRQKGGGRYSHWRTSLYFSASDSSDPRTNGRAYSMSVVPSLHPVAIAVVALIDLLALFAARRWFPAIVRYRRVLANVAIVAALLLAALAAAGWLGRINAGAGAPKDAALVVATVLHAVLGCAIALAQWMAGAGLARLALGTRRATLANVLLLGFALSLPLVAVLSVAALVLPHGIGFAAVGWALCCAPLFIWRPAADELAGVARVVVASLPLAIGFGCWMGLHWHGPTATLAGSPSGDLVYYATAIVSLSKQLYPYLNLGYEREPLNLYFNMLFSLLGAALSGAVALDPLLFIASSGPAVFILSLAAALYAYLQGTGLVNRREPLTLCYLALAIIAAIRYPYWVVESVPVVSFVPLIFSVVYFARKPDVGAQLLAFVIAVVGSALSKVAGAAVLAPVAAATITAGFFQMSRAFRIAGILLGAAAAIYVAILLYRLGSLNFSVAPFGSASVRYIRQYDPPLWVALPFVLRDLSAALLVVVAFLIADWIVASAIALGALLFLTYPFLFGIDFVCATIVLALIACDRPERLRRFRFVAFAALLLVLPLPFLTDPAGRASGFIWLVCVGGVVGIALSAHRPPYWAEVRRLAATAALVVVLGLVAAARGHLVLDSGWRPGNPELTPQVREIWLAVKERTPPDALIFTDQVRLEPTLLGGWNLYAFIGARQIFASNFYMNAATRLNRQLASDVLKENDAVLSGTVSPSRLPLRGRYSSYFAVVSRVRAVPGRWVKAFENEEYALYRIGGSE